MHNRKLRSNVLPSLIKALKKLYKVLFCCGCGRHTSDQKPSISRKKHSECAELFYVKLQTLTTTTFAEWKSMLQGLKLHEIRNWWNPPARQCIWSSLDWVEFGWIGCTAWLVDSMPFHIGFNAKNISYSWSMLSQPAKVFLKGFIISFKVISTYCDFFSIFRWFLWEGTKHYI